MQWTKKVRSFSTHITVFLLDLADYEQVQIVFSYLKLIRKLAISRLVADEAYLSTVCICISCLTKQTERYLLPPPNAYFFISCK